MTPRFIHERPLRVYWEITRACDLACRHCRAEAAPDPDPGELTPDEGQRVLEQLAALGEPRPHLVLTGGDPLKRRDLFDLIARGRALGLPISVAPSATPLLTRDALERFRAAGVEAISLSLDGSTAARHDGIRGITGTFERTLEAAAAARDLSLPFQINTLVCLETADDLPAIYETAVALGAARWSLFFLVTVGRGRQLESVSADHAEQILTWAAALGGRPRPGVPIVTTTEAPQLRRVTAQRRGANGSGVPASTSAHHASGVRDGNGVMFISHTGEVCPSGFLEVSAGSARDADVVEIYRTAPLFRQLRNPDAFTGRCGACEYRWACGGSRARAFSATGDPLAEDPLCAYVPAALGLNQRAGGEASAPGGSRKGSMSMGP